MDTNYSEVKNTDFTTSRQVNSTDPMKIILMVYEGAIKFLKKAVEYGEQGDIRNKNIYTNKAADIIVELNNSLNMKAGREIAENLRNMYVLMGRLLIEAITKESVWPLNEVIKILSELKEGWEYVEETVNKKAEASSGMGN